jgi:alpha-aminoadipate carrier protein LysW
LGRVSNRVKSRKRTREMAFAYCPDCVRRIYLGRKPWIGQPVTCESCGADLEVVDLNPLELDWAGDLPDEDLEEEWELELENA